ncbi:mycofactocin-coupled SDR family oxidoreductase [Tomitella biformata]|uniref:mycofactocin-coupled SDR family oxidoreductase n=1 Tax=Tomitella biformata TaxID=630403 RepID=UPI000466EF95|nr:mycofactocin-coupled SDR family oxidoreductase [Tomitella biformata]
MTGSLSGKVAFITGAGQGQGRSHAVRLAEEGADIIAVDICAQIDSATHTMATESDLAETARLVTALGRRVLTRTVDVRDRSAVLAAAAAGHHEFGRIDIVVANAGICPLGPDVAMSAFLDTVSVDLVGVVNTVEAAFPYLKAGASIVCTGSMAAMMGQTMTSPEAGPGAAGYAHAKRGVARFVHDAALQFAPLAIRVNAVHPGNIDTPMLQNDAMYRVFRPDLPNPTREDAEPAFGIAHQLPVVTIDPRDISEAVLYLSSDASRYVTGQQLKVDAGALLVSTSSGAPA